MNVTKEQANEAYRTYKDVMPDGIDDTFAARIDPIVFEIPVGSKVLDVGANSGEIMKLLMEKRQCSVWGIDMSELAVAKAKEKGMDVQIGDAENLPFEDNEFDVVLMLETINHIHDPKKALEEARRVLKPTGFLIGSCPHKNLERYIWEEEKPHHPYHDFESLGGLLDSVFKYSSIWTLKAAQFSVKFASTFMVDKPAEMLFKCGGSNVHQWWTGMKNKNVLRVWFGPTQYEGDVYYRMRGFAEKMREHGVESAFEEFDYKNTDEQSQWQNRCRNTIVLNQLDAILKVADVSVWQLVANADALAMLRCAKDLIKRPLITEMDDWLFDVPQYNIASGPYKPNSPQEWIAMKQLELSDAIITSTEFLIEKCKTIEQLKDKPYFVIPNSLDFRIWDHLKDIPLVKNEKIIRIGYSGCGNHGGDLHMIREPLKALLDEFPNLEFVWAVPMKDPHDPSKDFVLDHPRAKCINQWYTIAQFPQAVKNWDLDIGIAPLVDNNFNRSKSNLRWLEYSALKLPTVASRVEPFKKSVLHNEDGYVCRGSREWYDTLKALIISKEQRNRVGEAAYRRVKRDFNMDNVTDRYINILEGIKRESLPTRNGNKPSPQ